MDIGPVVAGSIYEWFKNKDNKDFLERLLKSGVKIEPVKNSEKGKLAGKTFVITGSLESMEREQAKEKIRALGGQVSESISKKTDYVVVGKEPGSKAKKAQKTGVKIISEKEFLGLIK